jgi:iron complex outermembrane recepter protein
MKHIYSLLIALVIGHSVYSQTFEGQILDAYSKAKIQGLLVTIVQYDVSTKTDSLGIFSFYNAIDLSREFQIRVSGIGYKTALFKVKNTSQENIFYLEEDHIELEEMVVVSNQRGNLQRNSVNYIEAKKLSELKSIPSTTLGDALSNMMGVYQSSTAIGISKPVIRGLQGIRVVTLLNGMRIENQQWGGDHGMGVSELGIGSIEVIKGPASVLYGADAMGGVLYLIDESYSKQNKQELQFQTQVESNTLGVNNQLLYKVSGKNWRFNAGGLYTNHADYQLPNGRYAGNSRFNEQAAKFNFGMNKKNWVMHVKYNFQRNRAGIPGHTHDSIPDPLSFQVATQKRRETIPAQLINNHFLSIENKFFFHKTELSVLTGHTYNNLTEYDEKVTIPGIAMTLNNSLMNIRFKTQINEKLELLYGFQGMYQQNTNLEDATETLLPKSSILDAGIYSLAIYNLKKWTFQTGLRGDIRNIKSHESFKGTQAIEKNYDNFNYTLGAVRNSKKTTFRSNIATGFRAPHITELLANGFHHGALRYEIGDVNLIPEKATQIDFSLEIHHEHLELILNPFFNYFQHYIYIEPTDTVINNLPVFEYKQMNQAYMYGADIGFHYHPHFAHHLHLESTFSYIRAEGENGNLLPLIPQARINSLVKYIPNSKKKWRIEQISIQHIYHFDQTRVAVYETVSKAYHLINIGTQIKVNSNNPFSFTAGVRNLLNERYISHLSRLKNIDMPHPGINFYIGVKYNFESVINK